MNCDGAGGSRRRHSDSKLSSSSSSLSLSSLAKQRSCSVQLAVLILTNLLVYQLSTTTTKIQPSFVLLRNDDNDHSNAIVSQQQKWEHQSKSFNVSAMSSWLQNPLVLPPFSPPNLPSIRIQDDVLDHKRNDYGGKGDAAHLGGFTQIDHQGISPNVWTKLITDIGVKSFLDVGCGRGISTRWFLEHGAKVLCVEGSHDAVIQSFLPPQYIVEHDYARGPWWPNQTYDVAWSVEFLEHVSRQYLFNYLPTFRRAALVLVTSSRWGGWHHVEIHSDEWWIQKMELYGFHYQSDLTQRIKQWAVEEWLNRTTANIAPNGKGLNAYHIMSSLKVFSNPVVAALPQHAHLFPEHGCFLKDSDKGPTVPAWTRPCGQGEETPLPPQLEPLSVTPDMHQRWHATIRAGITVETKYLASAYQEEMKHNQTLRDWIHQQMAAAGNGRT